MACTTILRAITNDYWLDAGPRERAPQSAVAWARVHEVQANKLYSLHPPRSIDAQEDRESGKYAVL